LPYKKARCPLKTPPGKLSKRSSVRFWRRVQSLARGKTERKR